MAQKTETTSVTAKTIRMSQLKLGKARYLVYIVRGENAPASEVEIWNIDVKKEKLHNKEVISVSQKWDFKDTVVHTAKSISSAIDFKPVYHESWWQTRGAQRFDVEPKKVWINNKEITDTNSGKRERNVYSSFVSSDGKYYLNWHLDLEVFSMLPLRKNTTFLIPFYEFGYDTPRNISYTTIGEDVLVYDGKRIKCWLLYHEEKGNKETFWISKKTNEVLKLKQLINENLYRYKIKLPIDE
ncbi:MAG: hypothetical protein JSS98_15740 [Bacteroidetes bacterium]|nr:hypothetical protein [Bacteroidota bacterium]